MTSVREFYVGRTIIGVSKSLLQQRSESQAGRFLLHELSHVKPEPTANFRRYRAALVLGVG